MPRQDGAGPRGMGSKTGRQMGSCEGAKPRGKGPCGKGKGPGLRLRARKGR